MRIAIARPFTRLTTFTYSFKYWRVLILAKIGQFANFAKLNNSNIKVLKSPDLKN